MAQIHQLTTQKPLLAPKSYLVTSPPETELIEEHSYQACTVSVWSDLGN